MSNLILGPGNLAWRPASSRDAALAAPVQAGLAQLGDAPSAVADIDPELADTAAFCQRYGVPMGESANCVIVAGRRGEVTRYAACVVLATMRTDVNGLVRRRLDARKASFAPVTDAVSLTGMEFGGITPVGLPADWPVLVDPAVVAAGIVVIGSGLRGSKLAVGGAALLNLPAAEEIPNLSAQVPAERASEH